MNSNYQEWHNTTWNGTVERIALRIARWRMLELLWKESRWTLREGIKSLMNHHVEPPWRTPINKGMKRKRNLKHKVNPCNDLDESSWWYNWEILELQESMKHLNWEFTHHEQTPEERIHYLDEARIRIMLCVSFTNLNWWQATDLAYYLFS